MAARYSTGKYAVRVLNRVMLQNKWSFAILANCMGLSKSFLVDCANGKRNLSAKDEKKLRALANHTWGDWKIPDAELTQPKNKPSSVPDEKYMRYLTLKNQMYTAKIWLADYEPIYQNHVEMSTLFLQQLHYLKSNQGLAKSTNELEIQYNNHASKVLRLAAKLHKTRERCTALQAQVEWYENILKP